MRFAEPEILIYLALAVFALAAFYFITESARARAVEKFAEKKLAKRISLFFDSRTRIIGIILSLAAVALMMMALARPQWGFRWKENKKKGLDMIIGLDTSRSMLAEDLRPNRLEFAKEEIASFVKTLDGDRVGLEAFSGSAFLECPITVDYKGYMLALNNVSTETVSKQGTSLSGAIREAVKGFEGAETKNKIFILISDGEHLEGDVEKSVTKAKDAGIKIFTIGTGSPDGAKIPVTDGSGSVTYMKDKDGKAVITKLNEKTLKDIAERTGGEYVKASDMSLGLDYLYKERLSKLEKRETEDDMVKVYEERFQIPLALACLLIVLEMLLREKYVG